ncbi:MAG: type II secretion system protein GspD [Candidatus Scalindua sp. AMX11]|nr:MAG: type II secretion system protein GspD [Candidatus Scalindua sp.]NOG86102.1 type II secretion system secretin GspD [Planctomycetota bacterium]RZV98869.1 MAG: type II secretion system protein GspD [Candidatus Scalindua sp. SCAELEC01]TDE66939.1 MAG: type II secretion system protein GspD [Candidatus Scalindua sp. AMX11]GJQ57746.1 MAG: type II secretion system protein GspD [Candidatus Scalindua sp.]
MIKNILVILSMFVLTFGAGCEILNKGIDAVKPVEIVADEKPRKGKRSRKWEWEIAPQEKLVEVKEAEPVQKEFVYPLEMAETEPYVTTKAEGEKVDITFNFQNADIKEVLNVILGEILEMNYTLDKRVTGLITLRTTGKYYRGELLNVIQAMLNINGFALVKDRNLFQVLPIQEARSEAGIIDLGDGVKTDDREVVTQIVPCKHVAPQTIIPTLRGLLTKAGFVIAPNDTHAIIISEKATNMDRLLKIIDTFDVPFFAGKALKFYDVQYVSTESLAKDLEAVVQSLGAKTKGPKMDISFISFEDTSRILVVTNLPELFSSVDSWISNIDVPSKERRLRLYVYKMQHEQAETTVPILIELFKEKITPTVKAGETAGDTMKIIADQNTNSIIVKALPSDYYDIKAIIETLDATPQQVLIESVIAEIKLTDELQRGIEYFFRHKGRDSEGGSISLLPTGITSGTDPLTGSGTKFFSINRDIDVIFGMISTETEVKVLSTPHLIVRDEQTASIQVGQSEPISTGSTTGAGAVTTSQIQYRDTGTILTITPRLGENDMVTLDITQEQSTAVQTTASGIDSPAFPIRKIETSLVILSGHTIYLGGIIDINETEAIKKVPLLGDIPYLGYLFSSKSKTKEKVELMVLITPYVINTPRESDELTKEFKEKLKRIATMEKGEIKSVINNSTHEEYKEVQ